MASFDIAASVVSNEALRGGFFLLGLHAPEISRAALPGQFCMVRTTQEGGTDPLLRRPFSIHDVTGDTILFLYRVVGRGTRILSAFRPGDLIKILGPLGPGFFEDLPGTSPVLVGGGLGIAPLLFFARTLASRARVILGARTSGELGRAGAFAAFSHDIQVATEDGSLGEKGLVTNLLVGCLDAVSTPVVHACGPWPMLSAVARIARDRNVPCRVSLEARMACGTGLCLGCAVPSSAGGYLHVCKEGPVFDAELVDWGWIP